MDRQALFNFEPHADALEATFVVPLKKQSHIGLLHDHPCTHNQIKKATTKPCKTQSHITPSESNSQHYTSLYHPLEKFIIEDVGKRGGVAGSIRSWYYDTNHQERIICFNMRGNKFCENIGRPHHQNNIIWNFDLKRGVCWQSCRDPKCNSFQGQHIELPKTLLNSLSSIDGNQ